ncbi:hypothetical protein HTV45_15250 [Streptomyces sp. CHD11]|uniref:hypothetical protein n=1 Tax=Streptomyces sp. CHD11 TaxID=2741325 RepID=UPI001BFCCEA1|nr:hypothetical protein [Streptomyces sp. CHD11]MBT3152224.1 hypothetical protein [Streptomyces sp. CHD11]
MGDDRKRDGARPSEHVCGSCRRPVDTVIERHKTLGIYVPRWTAGPCHNPGCERYVPEQAPAHPARGAPGGTDRRR